MHADNSVLREGSTAIFTQRLERCYNIDDLREYARKRLPKGIFDFLDRGAEDDIACRDNMEAFRQLKLRTRFLVDLTDRDMGTTLFEKRIALPLAIAPTGFADLCWYDGELALAEAAAAVGVPFTFCAHSVVEMETIARQAGGNTWIQVHMWRDDEHSYHMIERGRDLGFQALVVTIDSALGRNREYNKRNGFTFPFKPSVRALSDMVGHPTWLSTVMFRYILSSGMPRFVNYPEGFRNSIAQGVPEAITRKESMTWTDLRCLRDFWPRPLVVKGVLSSNDARMAVDHGADALVVSNHGGRTLDSAAPPISVLPEIVEAVGGRIPILLDSGVRRGSDIVKAIALGADAVLVGRPTLYGVSVAGRSGAEKALRILADEFEQTMAFVGCRTVSELDGGLVFSDGR